MELRHAEKKNSWVKKWHYVMGINYLKSKRFVERQGIVAVCSFHVTRKGRPYTPAGVACPQCKQSKSTPATVFTMYQNISNKSGITACSSQLDATTILWICQNHNILSHFMVNSLCTSGDSRVFSYKIIFYLPDAKVSLLF